MAPSDDAPRERVWSTPPGVKLCRLDELGDPGSRNFVLQIGEAFFHGFVVRHGAQVTGYVDRCPHLGALLTGRIDGYLTPDKSLIVCSWHGALFRIDDGLCVGGPCTGARLSPWAVVIRDAHLETA